MKNDQKLERFLTSTGRAIYRLPVLAFPGHLTNCYLLRAEELTLIDVGTGMPQSNESLVSCIKEVCDRFGENFTLKDVRRVIITHGHVDHFGGLNFVLEQSHARVAIHELDVSTIVNFDERLIVSSKNLHIFLARAGLPAERVDDLVGRNKWSKNLFKAVPVDLIFDEGPLRGTPFRALHTPGHCPGQVCLTLDDVVFPGDHVLSHITPHQSPEFITRYNGLGHYFESLRKLRAVEGISLALAGHEDEMRDLRSRIDGIIAFHEKRLSQVLDICKTPKPVEQISRELYRPLQGYAVLLGLLEAGAHVEYLYERGKLAVVNIDEIENEPNPVLLYQAT